MESNELKKLSLEWGIDVIAMRGCNDNDHVIVMTEMQLDIGYNNRVITHKDNRALVVAIGDKILHMPVDRYKVDHMNGLEGNDHAVCDIHGMTYEQVGYRAWVDPSTMKIVPMSPYDDNESIWDVIVGYGHIAKRLGIDVLRLYEHINVKTWVDDSMWRTK